MHAPWAARWAAVLVVATVVCRGAAAAAAAALASGPPQLVAASSSYPRVVELHPSGVLLACVGAVVGSVKQLQLHQRAPSAANFTLLSVVAEDDAATTDLANCDLLQPDADHAPSLLLVAYRHHTNCTNTPTPSCLHYRIAVSGSRDGGRTFSNATTVVNQPPPLGAWEPALYVAPTPGVLGQPIVRVAYAQELAPVPPSTRREQDIMQVETRTLGTFWGRPQLVAHVNGSRCGMPGVATLVDGSVLVVMEGFFTGKWGHYGVAAARSTDGGTTFGAPAVVYAPSPSSRNAGAPQVAVDPLSGAVAVSFMSNDVNASPKPPAWPGGAYVRVAVSSNTGSFGQPLTWPAPNVTVGGVDSYWPGLFVATLASQGGVYVEWGNATGTYIARLGLLQH